MIVFVSTQAKIKQVLDVGYTPNILKVRSTASGVPYSKYVRTFSSKFYSRCYTFSMIVFVPTQVYYTNIRQVLTTRSTSISYVVRSTASGVPQWSGYSRWFRAVFRPHQSSIIPKPAPLKIKSGPLFSEQRRAP